MAARTIGVREDIVASLIPETPCASIETTNYTPWWGGNWNQHVRDPKTLRVASLPSPETLKGVLRWVTRAAFSCLTSRRDYRQVDQLVSLFYGGVVKTQREEHLASLARLEVEAVLAQDDSREAGRALELCMQRNARIERGPARICCAPRWQLATMGEKDESAIRSLFPALPGTIRLRIRIWIDEAIVGDAAEALCGFTVASLVYALYVHGLGRGSSRGFGRFKIDKIDHGGLGPLVERLNSSRGARSLGESIQRLHEAIIGYAKRLYEAAGRIASRLDTHLPSIPTGGDRIPCLSDTVVKAVEGARSYTCKASIRAPRDLVRVRQPIRDVYDALVAIGYATMKQVWKALANLLGSTPGIGFHTWVTGLPRWQQETGYALLEPGSLPDSKNTCLHQNELRNVNQGRRKSPIILFPAPAAPSTIAIVAYHTVTDHVEVLEKGVLYHAGVHAVIRRGNRPMYTRDCNPRTIPCRHVVHVAYAAGQPSVQAPRAESDSCRQPRSSRCRAVKPGNAGCGPDRPAGVVTPEGKVVTARTPHDIVRFSFDAALGFIEAALR